jgi:hypothetical protein
MTKRGTKRGLEGDVRSVLTLPVGRGQLLLVKPLTFVHRCAIIAHFSLVMRSYCAMFQG